MSDEETSDDGWSINASNIADECYKRNPDMSMIDEYIRNCCNNNEDSNTIGHYPHWSGTILHLASGRGHHLIIHKLLDSNNTFQFPIAINAISEPYSRIPYGLTPLHCACEQDCPLTVRELLQHPNIDVNKVAIDRNGNHSLTPLHYACNRNHKLSVMELLKHSNIQISARESLSQIPLHIACSYRDVDIDIIRMLLDYKPEKYRFLQLTAKDSLNDTALHKACSLSQSAAVVQLMRL